MTCTSVYPVILCGGSGTRLWPLSRTGYAKQFLALVSPDSLLQQTALRVTNGMFEQATFVGAAADEFLIFDHLSSVNIEPRRIILEPSSRNTAAALALAALDIAEEDSMSVILVMPSDHIVQDEKEFFRSIESAARLAREGFIVTFGIEPTGPETGYGYIQCGEQAGASEDGFTVKRFVEKPVRSVAATMIEAGDCYWNSGIFMMRADIYIAELGRFEPEVLAAATASYSAASLHGRVLTAAAEPFARSPNISIDYAVMEKTGRAAVVPVRSMGWSDVGSFAAVWDVSTKDDRGNVVVGPHVLASDSDNCLIISDCGLVATSGIKDLIIIQTHDALLVTSRHAAQGVKELVATLSQQGRAEVAQPAVVRRPWGSYRSIVQGDGYQAKHIVVKPGQKLSLQFHRHRAEHWIVVRGTALVTCDHRVTLLHENQSTFIPLGSLHRLENPGKVDVELIEVQSGCYLGEDDIVRTEDAYGRIPSAATLPQLLDG